ncbi:response regulator [Streptomyces ipomoeae]|nr:response regulator [Streptomyces ipomoeae]
MSVVVLDQRMGPDLSGTELFQRLRAVRPDVRAIMLTGEASADEVGQALALGFHDYLPRAASPNCPEWCCYSTSRAGSPTWSSVPRRRTSSCGRVGGRGGAGGVVPRSG